MEFCERLASTGEFRSPIQAPFLFMTTPKTFLLRQFTSLLLTSSSSFHFASKICSTVFPLTSSNSFSFPISCRSSTAVLFFFFCRYGTGSFDFSRLIKANTAHFNTVEMKNQVCNCLTDTFSSPVYRTGWENLAAVCQFYIALVISSLCFRSLLIRHIHVWYRCILYEACRNFGEPVGRIKVQVTSENVQRCYTLKCLTRFIMQRFLWPKSWLPGQRFLIFRVAKMKNRITGNRVNRSCELFVLVSRVMFTPRTGVWK